MKTTTLLLAGAVGVLSAPALLAATKVTADLQPPPKRQATVTTAERLAQRKLPPPVPAEVNSPFNPPDFDKVEGADPRAAGSAAGAAPPPANAAGKAPPPRVVGDRETLETLAAQIQPSGMIELGGRRRLTILGKFFEVGSRFTASYNNQDYELELVAIDRTTFTLRYRGEEITRPIKPVR